jgi:hypothetical protein
MTYDYLFERAPGIRAFEMRLGVRIDQKLAFEMGGGWLDGRAGLRRRSHSIRTMLAAR